MTRGILLAGNESALLSALAAEAAKRVKSCAAALIPHESGGAPDGRQTANNNRTENNRRPENGETQVRYLDWNPASPVSARTLVLAARNCLEHIDDAILVCVPPAFRRPPEELAPAEIDRLIDCNIKGWFFLVRELAGVFKKRTPEKPDAGNPGGTGNSGGPGGAFGGPGGTLSLVLKDVSAGARDELPDLAGPSIAAAFRSFAQGLLISTAGAPYTVTAFSSQEPGEEAAFAAYIFKTIEDEKRNAGKWHKYGKAGFFGR
jgi:NAD(P)-dependent dehydrogenase (short-subunit alcohol dehydrogenase family)